MITDAAGNTIGRYPGAAEELPAIAFGSHTDTVPNGDLYDGALGVLAGLACSGGTRPSPADCRYDSDTGVDLRCSAGGGRELAPKSGVVQTAVAIAHLKSRRAALFFDDFPALCYGMGTLGVVASTPP